MLPTVTYKPQLTSASYRSNLEEKKSSGSRISTGDDRMTNQQSDQSQPINVRRVSEVLQGTIGTLTRLRHLLDLSQDAFPYDISSKPEDSSKPRTQARCE